MPLQAYRTQGPTRIGEILQSDKGHDMQARAYEENAALVNQPPQVAARV